MCTSEVLTRPSGVLDAVGPASANVDMDLAVVLALPAWGGKDPSRRRIRGLLIGVVGLEITAEIRRISTGMVRLGDANGGYD